MSKAPKKEPGFSLSFTISKDGSMAYDVQLAEGFEGYAADVIFKMNAGVLGPIYLGLINEKYPELIDMVAQEIKLLGEEFLEISGQNQWLAATCINSDEVFGTHQHQQNVEGLGN